MAPPFLMKWTLERRTLPFTCGGPSGRRERGPASGETACYPAVRFLRSSMRSRMLQDHASSKISRSPMIFDIRCAFRGRAQPELDRSEPMLFVELACGMVFLVRV